MELGYFDLYLDKAYQEGKVMLIKKDIYYRNILLFMQRLQRLVTFRSTVFVKTSISISLHGSALE